MVGQSGESWGWGGELGVGILFLRGRCGECDLVARFVWKEGIKVTGRDGCS